MTRNLHKLTDVSARSDNLEPGRLSDGGGLYLNVSHAVTKSWLFMWAKDGKRREMGLGAYPTVTLAKARKRAAECRSLVSEGRDPIAERRKTAEPTFGECADELIASMESAWRNDKHRAQWKMTLATYCRPIRAKRVSEISTDDVLAILTPIWQPKAETASRVRSRIERVLDFAKARGWRSGENPALWRGHLRNILPSRQKLTRGHHAAMAYVDLPAFMERITELEGMAARALEFLILTAARTGETLGARWSEFDLEAGVWVVPANRTKAGREHRVPLSERSRQIVAGLAEVPQSAYVFAGQKSGSPLSGMAMEMLLRRMKLDCTVHGFRSTFRDWVGDRTHFSRETPEEALGHRVGNTVEQAYRRSDALDKRRQLMDAWEQYCLEREGAKIIQLRA